MAGLASAIRLLVDRGGRVRRHRVGQSAVGGAVLAIAVLAFAGAGSARNAATITPAPAFSAAELNAYPAENFLTAGGGLTDDRYSTLNQITTSNASTLKTAWTAHFGAPAIKAAFGIGMEGNAVAY